MWTRNKSLKQGIVQNCHIKYTFPRSLCGFLRSRDIYRIRRGHGGSVTVVLKFSQGKLDMCVFQCVLPVNGLASWRMLHLVALASQNIDHCVVAQEVTCNINTGSVSRQLARPTHSPKARLAN